MAIITLTTDLGLKDFYVASIKGAIISQIENAKIVDITHEIPAFDIRVAAFTLRNCFSDFPLGSIHVIGVSPEANEFVRHVIVFHKGHYFIGADNGIFSLLFDDQVEAVYELNIIPDEDKRTFPTKDVFVQAACHLARGGTPEVIGKPVQGLTEKSNFRPVIEEQQIRGIVIYIDAYGNVTTNITKTLFDLIGKGKPFEIGFRRRDYNISRIELNYNDVPNGERLALFSTNGHLEIAMNKGNAAQLMGFKYNDPVIIDFKTIKDDSSTGPSLF